MRKAIGDFTSDLLKIPKKQCRPGDTIDIIISEDDDALFFLSSI